MKTTREMIRAILRIAEAGLPDGNLGDRAAAYIARLKRIEQLALSALQDMYIKDRFDKPDSQDGA